MMKIDFDQMAKDFMFGKINSREVVENHGAAFRKGKTYGSIERVLMTAFKKGQQKTELEIDLFAIGLSKVFKAHEHRILDKNS
jgi:hypothetical protein